MARNRSGDFSRGGEGHLSTSQTTRRLREMGTHVERAAKQALRTGAYKVVADAKSKVPVRTGNLRNSIKAEANRDGSVYRISANAKKNGVAYGQFVEFDPKIKTPFLYPALKENRQQIRENMKEAARQALRRGH